MWLKSFKIALAQSDIEKIDSLSQNMPKFNSIEQMSEARYLLQEASKFMQTLQEETLATKNKLKKNIEFMQSTRRDSVSKFDIK